jgi:tetratricopeptide (TPR) repeat protein
MGSGSRRTWFGVLWALIVAIGLAAAITAVADEPMFVRWLVADDPGDETIRDYWERAERDELEPPALVDLGTMLFYRGYPKDAARYYKRALDRDPDLYEAWFRMGLVEHSQGNLNDARQAYKRCLKKLTGHGWCNFYLGLLEEQLGHSSNALYYYRRALKFAPELADPLVNPEIVSSRLMLGVHLQDQDRRRFQGAMPMQYLEPGKVNRVRGRYEPTPIPELGEVEEPAEASTEEALAQQEPAQMQPGTTTQTPEQAPPPRPPAPRRVPQRTPTPDGAEGGEAGVKSETWNSPTIGNASSEALLMPRRTAFARLLEVVL